MQAGVLTALPVFNEAQHVDAVLDEVLRYSSQVLVVDDGSTDGTADRLAARTGIHVVRHAKNQGYGAALRTAFEFGLETGAKVIVTLDCDGQHEPQRIGQFAEATGLTGATGLTRATGRFDIVSGSRYLQQFAGDSAPPESRRRINSTITDELNCRLGLQLTDAFCGFKAYRTEALARLDLREPGYAMPIEFWVQAAAAKLRILELPVPLIYLEEERSFGGSLDDADVRLAYYRSVLEDSLATAASPEGDPTVGALCGETNG